MTYRQTQQPPPRLTRIVAELPQPERSAANRALRLIDRPRVPRATALEAVAGIVNATRRGQRKRPQDRRRDLDARLLVGARVPRITAELYRMAAASRGQSLYAWVCDALRHHYMRCSRQGGPEDGA